VAYYQTIGKNPYCLDCVMGFGVTATSIKTGRPLTKAHFIKWLNKQQRKVA
jgi:hypothetical protein